MILFIESIIAGIISSSLTVLFIEINRRKKETFLYNKFIGSYNVFMIDGQKNEGEVVELIYKGSRVINAQSKINGETLWESNIVMSVSNPLHGEGVYSYTKRNDFGLHTILITPDENKISIHFRNISHRDGRYGGLLWQKINP